MPFSRRAFLVLSKRRGCRFQMPFMPESRTNPASLRVVFFAWFLCLVVAAAIAMAVGLLQLWRIDRQLCLQQSDRQLDALYERIVPLWDRSMSLVGMKLLGGRPIPGEPYEAVRGQDVFVEADERSLFRFNSPTTMSATTVVHRARIDGASIGPEFAGWVVHLKFINGRLHGASAYNRARTALYSPIAVAPRIQRWTESALVVAAGAALLCLIAAGPLGPRWRRQVAAIGLAAAMLVVVIGCLHPAPATRPWLFQPSVLVGWSVVLAALAIQALLPARSSLAGGAPRCACGYDLTGNVSGVCPECGSPTRRGRIDRWSEQAAAIAAVRLAPHRFGGPCSFTPTGTETKLDDLTAAVVSTLVPRRFAGVLVGASLARYRFDLSDERTPLAWRPHEMTDRDNASDPAGFDPTGSGPTCSDDETSPATGDDSAADPVVRDDTPENERLEQELRREVEQRTREAQINDVRVKQVLTERRSLYRTRSYFVALGVTAAVAAAQLGIWCYGRLLRGGIDLFAAGYAVAIAGMIAGVIFSVRRIRHYNAELAIPVQTDPVEPPDFSTLSDGSQRIDSAAENLQRLYDRRQG